MIRLRKLRRGEPITKEWLDTVVDAIHEREIVIPPSGSSGLRGVATSSGLILKKIPEQSSGGSDAASPVPWQPYLSSSTASDAALRFRMYRGKCASRTPANMMAEFLAFGSASDTELTEEDAITTQVYLQVPTAEGTLGSGYVDYDQGTINIVQGDDLLTALGGSVPAFGSDGSLPAYIIIALFDCSWWGGNLNFNPGVSSYLDVSLAVSGTDCENPGRNFVLNAV
jgi:hypothetical protein